MRRYNQRLFRIARGILKDEYEALDVVQETYIKAYYQLHQFRGPDGFAAWLSRIATNEAMMQMRRNRHVTYTLDDPEHQDLEVASPDPQPGDELAARKLRRLLEDAIDRLPVDYRCVYVMRAIQQLSTRETAASLNISDDAVKTRYLRAKRSLQQTIEVLMAQAGQEVYEFAGRRCDAVVQAVLGRLGSSQSSYRGR